MPYEGEYLFEDNESAEEIPVHTDEFRNEYRRRLSEFCGWVKSQCIQLETDYQQIVTDTPLDLALTGYLERRASV